MFLEEVVDCSNLQGALGKIRIMVPVREPGTNVTAGVARLFEIRIEQEHVCILWPNSRLNVHVAEWVRFTEMMEKEVFAICHSLSPTKSQRASSTTASSVSSAETTAG